MSNNNQFDMSQFRQGTLGANGAQQPQQPQNMGGQPQQQGQNPMQQFQQFQPQQQQQGQPQQQPQQQQQGFPPQQQQQGFQQNPQGGFQQPPQQQQFQQQQGFQQNPQGGFQGGFQQPPQPQQPMNLAQLFSGITGVSIGADRFYNRGGHIYFMITDIKVDRTNDGDPIVKIFGKVVNVFADKFGNPKGAANCDSRMYRVGEETTLGFIKGRGVQENLRFLKDMKGFYCACTGRFPETDEQTMEVIGNGQSPYVGTIIELMGAWTEKVKTPGQYFVKTTYGRAPIHVTNAIAGLEQPEMQILANDPLFMQIANAQ